MTWDDVTQEASKYVAPLQATCPQYLDELEGLAAGAGVPFLSVLALNVRTEITFGLFTSSQSQPQQPVDVPSDGCTSLGLLDASSGRSFLSQNWDWRPEQAANLIVCHVSQSGRPDIPDIVMVTEAGIIGKIGFNAAGVGCCLNAICARGVDPTKLPIHFALRTVLESGSREEAIAALHKFGLAGSGHILVADATGSTGLECTPLGIEELAMDGQGRVHHTNHLILEHFGVEENMWLQDSPKRLARIETLSEGILGQEASFERLVELFKDEEGFPYSINRKSDGKTGSQTLFTIMMNLTDKEALVKVGRPTEDGKELRLTP